jgi:Tfp pilus assembly protein PilN
MQIQVNLLPGAKKSAGAGASRSINVAAIGSSIAAQVRDPWLAGAVGAVVVSAAAVGVLFSTQQATASELEVRLERALRDSTRYANVLEARKKVEAERDSVRRQVDIIKDIDGQRYVWAHLLDEVSAALPSYTWLVTIEQTSKAPTPPGVDTAPPTPKGRKAAKAKEEEEAKAKANAEPVKQPLTFRVVGQTVDMQALTTFMKQLEQSPFIEHVQLVRSEIVVVDGKDVTEFQLDAEYEAPEGDLLSTEPLVIPVR